MPTSTPFTDTAERIVRRDPQRSEATLQADIRQLLLLGQFGLDVDEVRTINLESPLGDGTRRRIDIEVGNAVIEVKRDLRVGNVLAEAVEQLTGYVRDQTSRLGRRYVGILTDGVDWHLYNLDPSSDILQRVSILHLSAASDTDRLRTWLDTILATATDIPPVPDEITRRLGVSSAAYELDHATLAGLLRAAKDSPEVALKRQLWAKLLRTSFGSAFADDETMFVDHTLLVLSAEVIAHAVVGFDLSLLAPQPAVLVSGRSFATAQIYGVVEADFFDWVMHVPGGAEFVTSLTQRLSRFNWSDVTHDVLKVLYESVIDPSTRHSLGEYYTPDWLANRMTKTAITDPLSQRVLDPACGSGTFLFQAIRLHLAAADAAGMSNGDALADLTGRIFGVDVHPVAVTFARVTYLLAIGTERITAMDRGPLSVPVYLGDSVQWDQHTGVLGMGEVTIATAGADLAEASTSMLFGDDLTFPERVVKDASAFDQLVTAMADRAMTWTGRGAMPSVEPILAQHAIHPEDQALIRSTFETMCRLHGDGRNHIWGYYVRNLVRPSWLARVGNKVDVLIGNPPWLRYAAMTPIMQERFTTMSRARGLILGRRGVSGRDLSSLFVVRAVELYLRPGGNFMFVMPYAALTRKPYDAFRSGKWASQASGDLAASFGTSWDLHRVKPEIFPVPAAVVVGAYTPSMPRGMREEVSAWAGRLPRAATDWNAAEAHLNTHLDSVRAVSESDTLIESPYKRRFRQGAVLAPRALLFVEPDTSNPLGAGAGRQAVAARRTSQEKKPWKKVDTLRGTVESIFVHPTYLGQSVLPFRTLAPLTTVLPIVSAEILTDAKVDLYPGLSDWWRNAEELWNQHRSREERLLDRIDFHRQLSAQLPQSRHRVVYTKAGNSIAAAKVVDPLGLIDHKLYWASASSLDEARYLTVILNSGALLTRVTPLQGRGAYGPRDFDKYVFRVPIPIFDPNDHLHVRLVALAEDAERSAAGVDVTGLGFQRARARVRQELSRAGLTSRMEKAVGDLLPSST